MAEQVCKYYSRSLSELEVSDGGLIALDNNYVHWSSPFILAISRELVRGNSNSENGMKIIFATSEGKNEEWTLYTRGKMLGLWPPRHDNGNFTAKIEIIDPRYPSRNFYLAERAYSGIAAIQKALQNSGMRHLDFYLDYFNSWKIVPEEGIEKIVRKLML